MLSGTKGEQQLRTIQRYLITKVVEGHYSDEHGRSQAEKVGYVDIVEKPLLTIIRSYSSKTKDQSQARL